MNLFSTEQVSKFHPDKYADQISDALLTAYLSEDKNSHCGIETMVKDNVVIVSGEVSSTADVDVKSVVAAVADDLGYGTYVDRPTVIDLIGKQSQEINKAVTTTKHIGAGDQGMMYGYATRESASYLPYGFDMANRIIKIIEDKVDLNVLMGDAKCQVTVDLDKPKDESSLDTILVSVCHSVMWDAKAIRSYITDLLNANLDLGKAKILVNPAGEWTIGGPKADCGLTGRKIVADQYGGYIPVGGGAFSGKDPTKVDRSAAYMARAIAKDMLHEFGLKDCQIQLAYAIGVAEPVSVGVKATDVYTCIVTPDRIDNIINHIRKHYDLTPSGIIKMLGLYDVDYEVIARGCHYYNDSLWGF